MLIDNAGEDVAEIFAGPMAEALHVVLTSKDNSLSS
jgi:hypothetical protein